MSPAGKYESFASLCGVFESISSASTKQERLAPLETLWIDLRQAHQLPQYSSMAIGALYFSYMRLITPQLDTLRATYGLKESKIAKYYVELLGLSPTSTDAIRFLHWKDPSKNSLDSTNFSDVVYVVLSKRGFTSSTQPLSVFEVNKRLDELFLATKTNEKRQILMSLLQATSATEQKWLIRILTKEMKMHLMHQSVLAAFHPYAMELYNNTNDLYYVCDKCTDPSTVIAGDLKQGIFLHQPIKPMLASVMNGAKLQTLLDTEKIVLEPKFDGERMMIHVSPDRIQYWTRNAKNYTTLYGPKFDHIIREALRTNHNNNNHTNGGTSSCILDGEFLLYDGDRNEYKEFGSNRTFALSEHGHHHHHQHQPHNQQGFGGDQGPLMGSGQLMPGTNVVSGGGAEDDDASLANTWFCYQVFDVLFHNGQSLLTNTLESRRQILRSIIKAVPKKIEVVVSTPAKSVQDIVKKLDECLTQKFEGVMIKVASSHYIPGERKLKWLKLKPDHVSGMADTLDLVVLGAYYGTKYGLRHLSHFLLGVWKNNSSTTPLDATAKFLTVCKVGTGYSEQELRELQDTLDAKWIPLPKGTVPSWLDGWKPGAGEVPDVYIEPRDSVVLEIFGYSFTSTEKFLYGYTVRFPRCHRVRLDKKVSDATDQIQLDNILESSRTRFTAKLSTVDVNNLLTVQDAKKQRKDAMAKAKRELQEQVLASRKIAVVRPTLMVTNAASIEERYSHFFGGYEICILACDPSSTDHPPKAELEAEIIRHGGSVVANPQPQTSILIASGSTNHMPPKVSNWVDQCKKLPEVMAARYASIDVVSTSWLMECFAAVKVLPLAPRHVIYAGPKLAELFRLTLDRYADSFFDAATSETLRASLDLVAKDTAAINQLSLFETPRNSSEHVKQFTNVAPWLRSKVLITVSRLDRLRNLFAEELKASHLDDHLVSSQNTRKLYCVDAIKESNAASRKRPRDGDDQQTVSSDNNSSGANSEPSAISRTSVQELDNRLSATHVQRNSLLTFLAGCSPTEPHTWTPTTLGLNLVESTHAVGQDGSVWRLE